MNKFKINIEVIINKLAGMMLLLDVENNDNDWDTI